MTAIRNRRLMERLRNSAINLVSVVKPLNSTDRRHIKVQLITTVIVFFTLLLLTQLKPVINEKLEEIYQSIVALEKTGSPGAAKVIPCASHPGKNCAAGIFGNAIAQMHGCCGLLSNLSNTTNLNP